MAHHVIHFRLDRIAPCHSRSGPNNKYQQPTSVHNICSDKKKKKKKNTLAALATTTPAATTCMCHGGDRGPARAHLHDAERRALLELDPHHEEQAAEDPAQRSLKLAGN